MALGTLIDCRCLHRIEKDTISESLEMNIHIIKDLIRIENTKINPDNAYMKRLKGQYTFITDLKIKVDNTPICKP
jgi:predicted nucleic acid-binding protein